jgi:hypothetical protein
MGIKDKTGLVELTGIVSDLSDLREIADKLPPDQLSENLPPIEELKKLSELVGHLLFLHGWQGGMMLTEKYRKKEPKEEKRCTCRCHTFGERCAGFGPYDNSCCSKPHEKYPEWATRIDPIKKQKLLDLFREEAKKIHSEHSLNAWVDKMDIPEHIKKVLQRELWHIGYHCANFDDVCKFDAEGSATWVVETLEKFL